MISKKFFLFFVSLATLSCNSKQKFEQKIQEKNCEAALEEIPENQAGFKLISKTQEVSGTLLSYAATGSAYTIEVLWDSTATFGTFVLLCAPGAIANASASKAPRDHSGLTHAGCLPGDLTGAHAPALGRMTRVKTKKWSCPNVDGISQSIRKVAQCYRDQGTPESQRKALQSLESAKKSDSFFRCLSDEEKNAFHKDLEQIKNIW